MAPRSQILLPYQQSWVSDKSPLKLWVKARQIGFSFAASLEACIDCVSHKTLWIFLSNGQRAAKELAAKAKAHVEALARVERFARGVEHVEDERFGFYEGAEILQDVLRFPNGSRIIALPANPDTARGYSGNVLGDEFAFHKDAKKIYAAMYPSVTRGYRIALGSTPLGESGMFYELATGKNGFSKHRTTIYEAVEQGLDANIDLLREGCPDEDIWQQEYCCQFISDATSWIVWEHILACEAAGATETVPNGFIARGETYLGMDVGRRKDLTVFWLLEQVGDVTWTRGVIAMRGASFEKQREIACSLMEKQRVRRFCMDASGIGMQLGEEMQKRYGSRVEPVMFTAPAKEDLAVRARRAFEERTIRIPESREIRSDIHAVRRYPTAAGHFRFDAERTENGHADRFWAMSLALMAANGRKVSTDFVASRRMQSWAAVGGAF